MKRAVMFAILISGIVVSPVFADQPTYMVHRTTAPIVIDGILDDPDWAKAKPAVFTLCDWETEIDTPDQTEAKLLWDDTFLYVAFLCGDRDIVANHFITNSTTFRDDCVEIFWNPNPSGSNAYNMFEINCTGNLLSVYNDLKESIHGRNRRLLPPHIAQSQQGTVNSSADIDTSYVVEVAIRFEDYPELSVQIPPKPGDLWRIGLNRWHRGEAAYQSQWSPAVINQKRKFHSYEDYGKVIFSGEPVQ